MSFTAKSVIFDIADPHELSSSYVGIRAIDFWFDGSKITLSSSDITGYATTNYSGNDPWRAFDTSLSKTGAFGGNGWVSSASNKTDQRLIVVFDTAQTFDAIKVTNFHSNGTMHEIGAKNVVINISSDTITDTTYEAAIANSTEIFDGAFLRNTTGTIEDDLTLDLPAAYSVTYDGNGNTSGAVPTDSNEYDESDTVTVLGNTGSLAKTDYEFAGWNTAANGTGTSYDADDTFLMGTENVTLYAVWGVVFAPLNMGLSLDAGDIIGDAHTTLTPLDMGLNVGAAPSESYPMPAFSMGIDMAMGDALLYVAFEPFNLGMSLGFGTVTQNIALSPLEMGLTFDGSPLQSIPTPPFELGLALDLDDISSFETGSAIIRYLCILTDAANGTTDLTLPMASFQARRRSGDPTYLSVVIPTVDYAAQIAARSNGTLKIQQAYEQNGVIKQTETIMETTLDEVSPDEGGSNQSTTLTGYSTSSYSAKAVTLSGVTYRTTRAGKHRYRLARPYIFLNPGDTVTFSDDGVIFVVDTMNYFINATTATIELASA